MHADLHMHVGENEAPCPDCGHLRLVRLGKALQKTEGRFLADDVPACMDRVLEIENNKQASFRRELACETAESAGLLGFAGGFDCFQQGGSLVPLAEALMCSQHFL